MFYCCYCNGAFVYCDFLHHIFLVAPFAVPKISISMALSVVFFFFFVCSESFFFLNPFFLSFIIDDTYLPVMFLFNVSCS